MFSPEARIPLARPDLCEEDIAEVVSCLKSGWITSGTRAARLETAFAELLGAGTHAIAVSSATSGLELALLAVGVEPGDEVITSAYTFTATAEAIYNVGAQPVLVDIERGTFNIDPARVAEALGPRTRAVIPVHIGGHACRMNELIALCRLRGVALIEDAAHALPTRCGGTLVGALDSDAAVFSFYATKSLTTGEGGMVTTRDAALARRLRLASHHGIDRAAYAREEEPSGSPWHYDVVCRGFKCNMSDAAAAIAIHQVERVKRSHERRVTLALRYDEALADLPLIAPPREDPCDHGWHLYLARIDSEAGVSRDGLLCELLKRGIVGGTHFKPLPLMSFWARVTPSAPGSVAVAIETWRDVVALPLFSGLTDGEQERVIIALRDILQTS